MGDLELRTRRFAADAHRYTGQRRKYTGEPYIVHPIAVAEIVRFVPHSKEMIAAAHGDELQEIHAALDVMALRKSLLAIHKNNGQRNTPDMVVPASAHAIDNKEGWTEVLEQISEAPDAVRKHLILELREDGGATSVLARVIAELTALNVRSIVCMRWFGTIGADIVWARPWGIAVDLSEVENNSLEQWQWLDGVSTFSGRIGAETFALNIRTAAVGQTALEAGFHHTWPAAPFTRRGNCPGRQHGSRSHFSCCATKEPLSA